MPCFCGGQFPCFCALKFVIYKLECIGCSECYIGKTVRELGIRIAEHYRAIRIGKGSALARHECRSGYRVSILARSENNSVNLRLKEGKMIGKHKPKINIRRENRAREEAIKMGNALRNRDSCKPNEIPKQHEDEDKDEDYHNYDFWDPDYMESSDNHSTEIGYKKENGYMHENGNGNISEREAEQEMVGIQNISFDADNYILLAAIQAHENNRSFITTTLDSDEAREMGIREQKTRSFIENLWFSTPIGIWFDDEKTLKQKFLNLGINVGITAVSIAIPFGIAALAGRAAVTAGTAATTVAVETGATVAAATTVAVETGATVAAATAATAATVGTATVLVAKLAIKGTACVAAYAIPGAGVAAPIICGLA